MLTQVICQSTLSKMIHAIKNVDPFVDAIELRLDYLPTEQLDDLVALRAQISIPVIMTLRSQQEGGLCTLSEKQRLQKITQIAECRPDFIDIEHHVSGDWLEQMAHLPVRWIRSYHNHTHTPESLETIYDNMQHKAVRYYKMVTQANNCIDALRVSAFCRSKTDLIAHATGEHVHFSRYLGPCVGSQISYCESSQSHTLGLPTPQDYQQHRFDKLNRNSHVYGLIGNPIAHSIGHEFHNTFFNEHRINALYIKITLNADQVDLFLYWAKKINLRGVSVTMPLKQAFSSALEKKGAINTLMFNPGIQACNTDGQAAAMLLNQTFELKQKNILIVGAGGSANGIAEALHSKANKVFIFNRTYNKAYVLAKRYGATAIKDLSRVDEVNIIISTVALGAQSNQWLEPIERLITIAQCVMDIVYQPIVTPLIALANQYPVRIIDGLMMFKQQAVLQQRFWQSNHEIL